MANDFAAAIAETPSIGSGAASELSRPTGTEPAAPAAAPTAQPRASEPGGKVPPAADPNAAAKPRAAAGAPGAAPAPGATGVPAPAAAPAIDPQVLAHARTQIETEYGDVLRVADELRTPEMQQVIPFIRQMVTDPIGFHRQYTQSLRMAGLLTAEGAPADPAAAAAAAPKPFTMPEPAFVDPNGKAVYAADQVKDIIDNVRQELQSAVKPFHEQRQALAEQLAFNQTVETQQTIVEDARTNWEGFKENEPAIIALLAAERHLPPNQRKFGANLEKAYLHVYRTQIRPQLEARIRQSAFDSLRKQARSNTLRPGAPKAGAGGKREVRSTRDAIEQNPELVNKIIGSM